MDYVVRIGSIDVECASAAAAMKLVREMRGRYGSEPHIKREERVALIVEWLEQNMCGSKSQILRELDIPLGGMMDLFKSTKFIYKDGMVHLAENHSAAGEQEGSDPPPAPPLDPEDIEEEEIHVPAQEKTVKQRIIDALLVEPGLTVNEIAETAGLKKQQVSGSLQSYRRTDFKTDEDHKWYLINATVAPKPVVTRAGLKEELVRLLQQDQPQEPKELARRSKHKLSDVFSELGDEETFELQDGVYWLAR